MSSAQILVIMNPVSGQGDHDKLKTLISETLEARGLEFELRETSGPGDALSWARETEAELVIVSGGDGTVMEALSGLIKNGRDIPLAQLPAGTANLLARALGVPIPTEEALELALSGVVVSLDVGYLPEHDRYFAIVAGAGWDARMIEDAPREVKNRFGFFAYVLSGVKHLFTLRRSVIELEIDGEVRTFRAHTVMLVNVSEIANTTIKVSEGSPHDGKFDLAIVAPNSLVGLVRLAYRLATRQLGSYRDLKVFSAERVRLKARPALEVQIDGEVLGETPFSAEIVPGGARLVVPESYLQDKQIKGEPLRLGTTAPPTTPSA